MTIDYSYFLLSGKTFTFIIPYQIQNCAVLMEDLNNIRLTLGMVMYVETGTSVLQFALQGAKKVQNHIACEMVLLVVSTLEESVLCRFAHALTHTLISTDELPNMMDMEMSVVTKETHWNGRVLQDADTILTITALKKRTILHAEPKNYLIPFYFISQRKF